MTAEERDDVIDIIKELPDDITIEQLSQELPMVPHIMKGYKQMVAGQTVSNAEAMDRLSQWLK